MSIKAKINFNTRHLKKGDPMPPYNGKLRLYNMRFCPYSHRAVLALCAKDLDFEVINIDLADKPEWFTSKSAITKVPALEIAENVSIYESLVIAEYLDDVYSQRPLLSKDPVKKAFDKIIVEASTPIHSLLFHLTRSPELVTDDVLGEYFKALDFIQSQLVQRGTNFLGGEKPGYVDYMIWPRFERLPAFNDEKITMSKQKYKVLLEYLEKMWQDPVVKAYAIPKEIYQEYNIAYMIKGLKHNYDLLVEK